MTTSKCFWIRATALGSTIALGVTLTAPSVRAQELQEIVVTAQKRSENVQDVPIAVTAISPTQIEAANIDSLMQLQLLTPDLTFSQNALYARNYIRGVGSYVANPGLEPSVATYIDDVYTYRQIGAVYGTLDQQDVEVLKGPQGALYGKNATGGAILMYSANPTNKDEGMLEAEYGRFNRQEYEGMINIPVSDTFKIRVAARWLGEDGYIANSLGNETGGQRGTTARIKLDWTPNDVVDFLLSSEWSNSFYNFNIHQERLPAPLCVACLIYGLTPPPANSYSTSEDILPSTQVQYGFETLKSTVDLSWAKLVSITAYRQEKWDGGYDIDMTTAPFEHFEATEQADTTSQSFRLTSDTKGIFDYLVGVDWDRDNARFYSNIFGDAFAPLPGIQNLSHVISTSTAVYGEGYYRFATGWQLTVGARYNRDSKQFYGYDNPDAQVAEGNVPARFSEAADFTDVTPRVVLAYQHGGAHYYISYNQGFKSGGLNTPAFTTPNKVNPEKLNSVEAGVKIDWLDGRLRTNFDVFHYNYNDLQVSITDIANGGLLTQNAASARIYGVEFDSTLAVTQSLTLGLGADFLHARYTSFPDATCYVPAAVGFSTSACNLDGYPLDNAPNFNGTFSAAYKFSLPWGWDGDVSLNGKYSSQYDFLPGGGGPLGLDRQGGYFLGTMSGYLYPLKGLRVGIYVDNFTNKFYVTTAETGAIGAFQIPAEPRTYGVSLTYKWGN